MKKIFVYNDFDVIAELEEAVKPKFKRTWMEECQFLRENIKKIINVLKKSLDVVIKEDLK